MGTSTAEVYGARRARRNKATTALPWYHIGDQAFLHRASLSLQGGRTLRPHGDGDEILSSTIERSAQPREALTRVAHAIERVPWLIPTISFVTGVIGFVMVKRGAELARFIAIVALAGWVWLLVEPLVRRYLERHKSGIGKFVSNFLTQSLQQEVLFFSLPFLFGSLQRDIGQIAFIAIAAGAALLTALDPLYERWIAARAATRLLFHAYCSLIAAVVVVPMVVHLSLEQALPLSLGAVGVWLLLTSPMSLRSLRSTRHKLIWVACSTLAPLLVWLLRAHVPPAGLAVTQAVITQSIVDRTPGPAVRSLTTAELSCGRRRVRRDSRAERRCAIHQFRMASRRGNRAHHRRDPRRQRQRLAHLLSQGEFPGQRPRTLDRRRENATGAAAQAHAILRTAMIRPRDTKRITRYLGVIARSAGLRQVSELP